MRFRTLTTYDPFGRALKEAWPNGTVINWEYRGPYLFREWVEGDVPVGAPNPPTNAGPSEVRVLCETWEARYRSLPIHTTVF
jgi:hypothetical protein